MKRTGSDWTEERETILANLWTQGHTGEAIAHAMGGLTRCGVIGKARRMGLMHRVSAEVRAQAKYVRKPSVPKIRALPPPQPVKVVQPEPLALGPIGDFPDAGTCRYIAGDPASQEWQCCGAEAVRYDIPWCEHHFKRVYQPATKRERKAA